MKNIYKIFFAFISVLAISCNGDAVDERPILEAITAPEITAPQSGKQYVLTEDNASSIAETFKWSAGVYSTDVVVKYTVLMDKKGGDFTAAKAIAATSNATEASVLVVDLNKAAAALGAVPEVEALYDVKVVSNVSGSLPMASKTPLTIAITTYKPAVANNCPNQYAVGAGIPSAGWNWNSPLVLICNDQILNATADLVNDSFRFFTTSGDWNSGRNYPWYVSAGYKISSSLVNAADGDQNFRFIGTPDKYRIKIDEVSKTLTVAQGETPEKSNWLVGDATPGGWSWSGNNETEFPLISNNVFEVPITLTQDKSFRVFLANDGTDNGNWGTSHNYPYYANAGYVISPELVNANDGDSNFKYTGPTGLRVLKIDNVAKTITLK